ncbi:GIY-YIG nuclease family protein [Chryseobacterium sp. Marseille-Q8038]
MKQYFVYILKCSDNSYYTGVTNDIELRLSQHQAGKFPESYTYKRRPVQLVFFYLFNDIIQAIAFEKQVKGWSRKKKEAIINDNWDKLRELSICRNDSHCDNCKDKTFKGFDSAQPDTENKE